jgi:hypothetical protein
MKNDSLLSRNFGPTFFISAINFQKSFSSTTSSYLGNMTLCTRRAGRWVPRFQPSMKNSLMTQCDPLRC